MADSPFSLPAGDLPADVAQPTGFLQTLLSMSLTAVAVLRPLYAADGETIRDFAWVSLNPAGQRMLGQPACPAGSLLTLFPAAQDHENFARYCHAYLTGQQARTQTNYQADGIDGYFLTVAQRYENVLLVNFTDTNEQPRSAVEEALRQSQAAEQVAYAQVAEAQTELYRVLQELPLAVAVYEGPAHALKFYNSAHQELAGRPLTPGRPAAGLFPGLADQAFFDLPSQVYATGEAVTLAEIPLPQPPPAAGRRAPQYVTVRYAPRFDTTGQVSGILATAVPVTEQVEARQQVHTLNQELAARNEELRASNQEYLAANRALSETQHQLRQLNAELEARVQERTQVAEQALATAERERTLLQIILDQSPVAIGVFQGEEMRITTTNAQMAALWGRTPEQVLNLPFMDAVPELRGQGFDDLLRQVLHTRVPFIGTETPADVLRGAHVQTHYYNFVYQPLYDAEGEVLGVIDVAVEVTEQVLARRQVEQLNQELEARVQQRTEQLQAAQAAAERERAQLQALLTQAPVAISLFEGDELRVALANPLITKLWGYPPEQVLGRPLLEAVPELQGQGFDDLLRQVLHTRVPFIGKETPALLRSNDQLLTIYFNFVYQPLYDAEGQVAGVINVATDVTEQVLARQQVEQLNQELEARVQQRTQQALGLQAEVLAAAQQQAQAREAFHQVFEQTPALVALLRGADHRYEYVNPAYQALFAGRTLVGLPVAEAVPELAAQGFNTLLKRVYQTGETYFGLELPFTPAAPADQPARTRYYTFTYQALREADEVVGISIFAYDVTAQIQEREASSQQLRLITDSLPVLISYVDGEQRYRFVNYAYQAWFNQRPENLLGQSVREVVGKSAYEAVQPYIERALAGERLEFESRMPYRAGFTKHIHTTYVPAERRGEQAGFYTLTFDVTEQVLARQQVQALNEELTATNQELQQTNQQLTRTNVDLDTFVYTASHDLKAPITNIESITLALRDVLPAAVQQDEMIAHLLDLLEQTTTRFQLTISQLTDLSKLQLAHAGPAEPVNLAAVIESVRLDLAPLILAADAQLTVAVAPDLLVSFSPGNLRSAVYNLLSNAVKYRALDRPAQVRVRAFPAGGRVTLEVQDNGLGLNEHQQSRLFGLFQRLHTHVEGTGVGLYTTKRLVENGGGTIAVESQVDVGTTFTLTFPA